jgi:hypothetical protein
MSAVRMSEWHWSDHSLVLMSLARSDVVQRCPSYWHLNVAALDDKAYRNVIE